MDGLWIRKRILIWGKTRPELSKTYKEIVCTGGVFHDAPGLIRLYPIPLRYMDDERVFKKYQWIEAYVRKAPEDARPESYKIRADDIKTFDTIPTKAGNWNERARWILRPEHMFSSVEALQARQAEDHTSLGLVKPREVYDIKAVQYTRARYKSALSQMELPLDDEIGREVKPLRPSDYRFKIKFVCDDKSCSGHEFSVLDWELDALYTNQRVKVDSPESAAEMVEKKLRNVCEADKDLYFFLGNISNHPQIFTIVGLWYPRLDQQLALALPDDC
jgi:hypothetical protein